jgi:hypothetical protein
MRNYPNVCILRWNLHVENEAEMLQIFTNFITIHVAVQGLCSSQKVWNEQIQQQYLYILLYSFSMLYRFKKFVL